LEADLKAAEAVLRRIYRKEVGDTLERRVSLEIHRLQSDFVLFLQGLEQQHAGLALRAVFREADLSFDMEAGFKEDLSITNAGVTTYLRNVAVRFFQTIGKQCAEQLNESFDQDTWQLTHVVQPPLAEVVAPAGDKAKEPPQTKIFYRLQLRIKPDALAALAAE
jgi:hypothetical protein